MRYRGILYRALNPIWAREPLSGEGARRYGGRFNRKGTAALYTSLLIVTAIREANQIGTLQPVMLVSYRADFEPVFDATEAEALEHYDWSPSALAADDWRIRMRESGEAPSQGLAARLIAGGYVGIKVRSFARGATEEDMNLVLWAWGPRVPDQLLLIDDERRLG